MIEDATPSRRAAEWTLPELIPQAISRLHAWLLRQGFDGDKVRQVLRGDG